MESVTAQGAFVFAVSTPGVTYVVVKKLLSTVAVARKVGMNRVTLQKWMRVGRVKAPKLTILNGRAVRLWSSAEIQKVQDLKEKSDYFDRVWQHVKTQAAKDKEEWKAKMRARSAGKT